MEECVFDYMDYRKYLKNYYEERKKEKPFFSHRYIANRVNFNSSFFARLIKGERHISLQRIPAFVKLLKLTEEEGAFFRLLVMFSKAKTEKDKKKYYALIHNQVRHPLDGHLSALSSVREEKQEMVCA